MELPTAVVTVETRVKTSVAQLLAGGLTASFFNFFQGRATWFALVFLTLTIALVSTAIWGFVHGRDLTGLGGVIAACGGTFAAIQACVFAHSAKEDWNTYKQREMDMQQAGCTTPPAGTPVVLTGTVAPGTVIPPVQVPPNATL